MSEKSEVKKQMIINKAREVFALNGYKNVTMKDIVEACEISRGGLYLYFSSVKRLFEEVLEQDISENDEAFENEMSKSSGVADILALFLKEQKKEILKKDNTLTIAIYEYFFENKIDKKENTLYKQFDIAVKIVQLLIKKGVESGEFRCEDPLGMARTTMFLIEGLKVSSKTMGVSESLINKQMLFILKGLVPDSE